MIWQPGPSLEFSVYTQKFLPKATSFDSDNMNDTKNGMKYQRKKYEYIRHLDEISVYVYKLRPIFVAFYNSWGF